MNPKKTLFRFLTIFAIIALTGISFTSLTKSAGADAKYTGAPGPTSATNEGNCTNCHTGTAATSGTNWNNVDLSGTFQGGGYIPDSTYTITISYTQSGRSRFGFQTTVLNSANVMVGDFTNTSTNTSKKTATVASHTRQYIGHSGSGTSGSGSISWSFDWTAPSTNMDTVTFYVAINSTNNDSKTGGDLVLLREFNIGPSSWLPDAEASASSSTVCSNTNTQLSGSSSDTTVTYSWSLAGSSPSTSNAQNPTVKYFIGGSKRAILTTTNAYGKSIPDTLILNVINTPTASISGTDRMICEGDSVQLLASFDPNATYLWSNGASGTNSIYVKDSGEYTVTVSKSSCSAVSNAIHVGYLPKPMISLSSDVNAAGDTSCSLSNIVLIASGAADSFFYFDETTLLSSTTADSLPTFFDGETAYSLLAKGSNGCLSDTAFYTVYEVERLPAPIINCNILSTSAIEFEWDATFFHNGFEVSLDSGDNWNNPSSGATGTTHEVSGLSPDEAVQLWVRAHDLAPCLYSEVGTQICKSDTCKPFDLTIDYNNEVCENEEIEVVVHGLSSASYSMNFEATGAFSDSSFLFTPTISKNYILEITDSSNLACPVQSIALPVVVNALSTIGLVADDLNLAYCAGESAKFTVNDSFDQVDFYYNDVLSQSGAMRSWTTTSPITNGDSVWVVVSKGFCSDTSESAYLNIFPLPEAGFSYDRLGANFTLTPDIADHDVYAWDFGDGEQSADVSPVHDYSSSEGTTVTVCLEVTGENECIADSCIELSIPDMSSIEALRHLGVSIYPNPAQDFLQITHRSSQLDLSLSDIRGQVLLMRNQVEGSHTINLTDLASGVYLLQLTIDGKQVDVKILKD